MCGVFGVVLTPRSEFKISALNSTVKDLFRESESRGKEAAGIAISSGDSIQVYKEPRQASRMIASVNYRRFFDGALSGIADHGADKICHPLAVIGHSRLVTDGSREDNQNNQPVIKDGIVGVHNGIVTNAGALWDRFPALVKKYDVDTEILLSLIRFFLCENARTGMAVRNAFQVIQGSATLAALFKDRHELLLATNTGSLYIGLDHKNGILVFSSEQSILESVLKSCSLKDLMSAAEIFQVAPRSGYLIDTDRFEIRKIDLRSSAELEDEKLDPQAAAEIRIKDVSEYGSAPQQSSVSKKINFATEWPDILKAEEHSLQAAHSLRRCQRCILPETFPFIRFNEEGVCNYCLAYKKAEPRGAAALAEAFEKFKSTNGSADCVVALSGGRDSCFGLHYLKKVLGARPVAFSYDWGMLTDLGRRNQARMCGKLGVEHIVVSADIVKKREYIRKNILAWLKKPDLGLIPLFMAGDKQYFYYANVLKKRTGAKFIVMCENPMERGSFKHGFCGVRHSDIRKPPYEFNTADKLRLAVYYARQFLLNPAYLNASIPDTLGAYLCYYLVPHDYLYLFEYLPWDEKEIISTLCGEYDWETALDTDSTWRIGDGTAPFYNLIYFALAGFTENDAFRSNQIREGVLTRSEALERVTRENQPRWESIQWYCVTIGIDFKEVMRSIFSIPRLRLPLTQRVQ